MGWPRVRAVSIYSWMTACARATAFPELAPSAVQSGSLGAFRSGRVAIALPFSIPSLGDDLVQPGDRQFHFLRFGLADFPAQTRD